MNKMLEALVETTAREINLFLFWQSMAEPESEDAKGFCNDAGEAFCTFYKVVDAIYPKNDEIMNTWTERLMTEVNARDTWKENHNVSR